MKKLFFFLFFILAFSAFAQNEVEYVRVASVDSGGDQDSLRNSQLPEERVIDFHSDIDVSKKSVLTVTETIKVYASGNEIKRGIFRALPMIRNINGGRTTVDYKIISIKVNGASEDYHIEKLNEVFNIYIGSKDVILNPGIYTYEITYQTRNQIGFFGKYDELYWNVNGTDWSFPVEHISAKIKLPEGADIIQNSCYTGIYGSKDGNCTYRKISSTEISFEASDFKPEENLTIAVGFKPNVLEAPSAISTYYNRHRDSFVFQVVGVILLLYFVITWFRFGRNSKKPVVIPEFNPPKGLSPASIGYIESGEYDTSLLAANLVDMAVKKVISLKEDTSHQQQFNTFRIYDIRKLSDNSDALQSDEAVMLNKLFEKKTFHIRVDGNYNWQLKNVNEELKYAVEKRLVKYTINLSNSKYVYRALLLIVITFFLGMWYTSAVEHNYKYLGIGALLVVFDALIVLFVVLLLTSDDWKNPVSLIASFFLLVFTLPTFFMAFGDSSDMSNMGSHCLKFLILSIAAWLIYRRIIKKPSDDKVAMKAEIAGFKMYLGAAEEEQLKFHNPPEMTSDLYEKYLPYAMVLGVQKIWGKRFRKTVDSSVVDNSDFANFAYDTGYMTAFSKSLVESSSPPVTASSFSSSSSSSSSSSRSSSSSSYSGGSSSSGSSGGGSSGGGGGGGGGGGW